jgi:hypothetical protein
MIPFLPLVRLTHCDPTKAVERLTAALINFPPITPDRFWHAVVNFCDIDKQRGQRGARTLNPNPLPPRPHPISRFISPPVTHFLPANQLLLI